MKKGKLLTITLTLSLMLLATGCGNKESGDKTTTAQASAGTEAVSETKEDKTEDKKAADDSWVFKKGDVTVAMNAPSDETIKALGGYQNSYEAPSCAFDGMDVVYTYPGFEVLTYSKDGKDGVVTGVILRDDTVMTPEGVYIGADQATVEKAYGSPEAGSTSVTVKKGNCDLLVIMEHQNKDDETSPMVVTSIQYSLAQ